MVRELLDNFSGGEFPNYDLGVVSRADYIFVTVANDDPSNIIKVGMK